MNEVKKLVGEALSEIISSAKSGGPKVKVGLMASGSELGAEELAKGARIAVNHHRNVIPVMIGPKISGYDDLEWIETAECDADIAENLEAALKDGRIQGAVALHFPFPLGVTTIGRVLTPGRGKDMIIASTTGTSATQRGEAMLRNAVYGIATAKALGNLSPTLGILNVDTAQPVFRALQRMKERGYDINFGASVRKDGGALLRGNDILVGAVDICVTDTLTGNIMMKMLSSFTTGGSYESTGSGYGPGIGENYNRLVLILSRASGAPVVANAIRFAAQLAKGDVIKSARAGIANAKKAGLDEIIASLRKPVSIAEEIKVPEKEIVTEEISGIDIMSLEDAAKELWKAQIYAESGMGCTGPVVLVSPGKFEKAVDILKKAGYIAE